VFRHESIEPVPADDFFGFESQDFAAFLVDEGNSLIFVENDNDAAGNIETHPSQFHVLREFTPALHESDPVNGQVTFHVIVSRGLMIHIFIAYPP
jgi:hypothetical protein